MARIWNVHPVIPEDESIQETARLIKEGGSVIVPTRCLYGIAVDAFNPSAVRHLFHIKKRETSNPILVLIHHIDQITLLSEEITPLAKKIIQTFWPGQVTIVCHAKKSVSHELTSGTGKIGIRLVGHPVTRRMIEVSGTPVTGTSANLSGEKGCRDIKRLSPEILRQTDGVLNTGKLRGGIGSTVVDTTSNQLQILREGVISMHQLYQATGWIEK